MELARGEQQQSCVRMQDDTVRCWGRNDVHQAGDGPEAITRPTPIEGLTDVAEVSVGYGRTCAVQRSGHVFCWGQGFASVGDGEAAQGSGTHASGGRPIPLPGLEGVVALAVGGEICGLQRSGRVTCWGTHWGEDGTHPSRGSSTFDVGGGVELTGTDDMCALRRDGRVTCFGGTPNARFMWPAEFVPVLVPNLDDAVDLATGTDGANTSACAVRRSGQVVCWDMSRDAGREARTPAPLPGVSDAIAAAVAGAQSFALRRDGTVARYFDGQLRTSSIEGLLGVVQIVAGQSNQCAVTSAGAVLCSGSNDWGELGVGETGVFPEPVEVPGITDAVQVALGFSFSCALQRAGKVLCWGARIPIDGEPRSYAPWAMEGVENAVAIVAHAGLVCATLRNGSVTCRDRGRGRGADLPKYLQIHGVRALDFGRWWNGKQPRHVPVWGIDPSGRVVQFAPAGAPLVTPSVRNVAGLSVSEGEVYGVNGSGEVVCWSTQQGRPSVAVTIPGVTGAVQISAHADDTGWVVTGDGALFAVKQVRQREDFVVIPCAGHAEKVPGMAGVSQVASGQDLACARLRSGQVVCDRKDTWKMALNGIGQRLAPRAFFGADASPVKGLSDAVDVAVGGDHACAVRAGGKVVCWGSNAQGQLGQPDRSFSMTPVQVIAPQSP